MKKLTEIEKNFFLNKIHLEFAIENAIYDKKIYPFLNQVSNYVLGTPLPKSACNFLANKYHKTQKELGPGFNSQRKTILDTMNFIYYELTPCKIN